MVGETQLIDAAGGDFIATLAAVLAIFIMAVFLYFLNWVMKTIPEQMQKDREAIVKQMAGDREAICAKLGDLITEMRDTKCNTQEWLEKHDEQAKKILETDQAIRTNLDNRPCALKR